MRHLSALASFRNLRRLTLDYKALNAERLHDSYKFHLVVVQYFLDYKSGVPLEELSFSLEDEEGGEFSYSADYGWGTDGRLILRDYYVSNKEPEDGV